MRPVQSSVQRPLPILLLCLVTAAMASAASAAEPRVRDEGKFFSSQAVDQANRELAELWEKRYRSVIIQTYQRPPRELAEQLGGGNVARAFGEYARAAGEREGADFYVLISREPSHLRIAMREVMQQAGLSNADRDRIADSFLTALRQQQYDRGLLEMVAGIREELAAPAGSGDPDAAGAAVPPANRGEPRSASPAPRTGAGEPPPASPRTGSTDPSAPAERGEGGGGLWASLGCMRYLIIGLVIVLVMSVIRRIFAGRRAQPAYGQGGPQDPNQPGYGQQQPGPGGGGGGFGRGLAGGILGGMLGGWLGNQTFGQSRGGETSSNDPNAHGTGPADPGINDPGSDAYSDTGGDFSADDGGGDFGGDAGGDF